MSISLGDVFLYFKGDDSQLDQTFNKAEGKAKSFASSVGGFLIDSAKFAVGGFIEKGIGAVSGAVGDLVGNMVGGNAAFENYNQKFTVLLGSAEAAQDRLADLADFGAKTPFELPQVVEADTILQGFGLHSEEAAKKFGYAGDEIRTIAGDVASGTGASFQEMALLIGKFSSGATGEAISRMQELGITNRDELAKMGLEFSKSGELLSPLPESMNVILGLMKEKYGGLMDAQSTTFSGMMSNLQDWMAGTGRELGKPIFDVLKNGLTSLLAFLGSEEVKASIATFTALLASGIRTAIDWLITTAIPNLQQFAAWFMSEGWPAIQPFIDQVISQLLPGLQQLGTWAMEIASVVLPLLSQSFTFLMDNINIILPILGVIGAVILALTSPITAIVGLIIFLATAWANNWGGIQEKTQAVMDFLKPYWDQLVSIFNRFITQLLPPLQQAWQTLVQVWQTEVGPALDELWATLGELFTELGLGTGDTDLFSMAMGLLKIALVGAVAIVRELTPAIRLGADVIVFMIDQVKTSIDNFVRFKRGIEGVIDVVKILIEKIKDMATELVNMVVPDFLETHSPTPLEMGLRGIASAIDSMPQLNIGANLTGISPLAAAGAGAGGVGSLQIVFNGGGAPKDEREANDRAFLMVEALRTRGIDL